MVHLSTASNSVHTSCTPSTPTNAEKKDFVFTHLLQESVDLSQAGRLKERTLRSYQLFENEMSFDNFYLNDKKFNLSAWDRQFIKTHFDKFSCQLVNELQRTLPVSCLEITTILFSYFNFYLNFSLEEKQYYYFAAREVINYLIHFENITSVTIHINEYKKIFIVMKNLQQQFLYPTTDYLDLIIHRTFKNIFDMTLREPLDPQKLGLIPDEDMCFPSLIISTASRLNTYRHTKSLITRISTSEDLVSAGDHFATSVLMDYNLALEFLINDLKNIKVLRQEDLEYFFQKFISSSFYQGNWTATNRMFIDEFLHVTLRHSTRFSSISPTMRGLFRLVIDKLKQVWDKVNDQFVPGYLEAYMCYHETSTSRLASVATWLELPPGVILKRNVHIPRLIPE